MELSTGKTEILGILDLKTDDYVWVKFFQKEVTRAQIKNILDECYKVLFKNPKFKLLINKIGLNRLRKIHTHQLLTIGRKFDTSRYFNERLNIGQECARIRFPLSLLHLLYFAIQMHLLASVSRRLQDHPLDLASFADYLLKIFALDIYLAIEAYRQYEAEEMTRSLEDLREVTTGLHHKAHIDELTGVCTYSRLMDVLDRQIDAAKCKQKPLSVMMSDLDSFKDINDTYGHLVGDEVLRYAAERIQSAVRDFDVVGRFGGDEFVIILENTDRKLAKTIGERIRRDIAATPIHTRGLNIPVTISIGLTMLRTDECRDAIIERADMAMYEAKRMGRNRLCVAPDAGAVH